LNASEYKQEPIPKYAVYLAYTFLFVYYTRFHDNIPGFDLIPWVGVLFLLFSLLGILWIFTNKVNFFTKHVGLVFWLGLVYGISGIGAINVAAYRMSIEWIFEIFPQCVALVIIFSSLKQLKALHNFWCLIFFFMAIFTFKNLPSGPGDFSGDANDACLTLGMGIPFVYYALQQPNITQTRKLFLYLALFLLFAAVIGTSSRGGFLGVVAGLLTIWWMSRSRIKVMIMTFIAMLIIGSAFLAIIPDGYVEDMRSIGDKENSTRVERFRTWEISWEMFKSNPVLGVGAANFPYNVSLYQNKTSWWTEDQKSLNGRQSHSVYFQVIPDLGIVGVLIFGYIMFMLPLKLLKLKNRLDDSDPSELQLKLFCKALIASMAVYAVAGAFISVAYYPHLPVWLFMYTVVLNVTRQIGKEGLLKN
jgi:O-antigen ligase